MKNVRKVLSMFLIMAMCLGLFAQIATATETSSVKYAISIEMGDWTNQFGRKENWFDGYIGQPLSERNHNATYSETGNHIVSAESGKELVLYVKYDISALAGKTVDSATLQMAPNDNDGNSSKEFNVFRVPLANWQTTNGPAFDTSAPLDTFKTPALPWTYTKDADFRKTKEGSGSTYAYIKGTDKEGTTAKNGFNVASAVQDAINNNETHVCFAIGRVSDGRGTFSQHFYPGLEVYASEGTTPEPEPEPEEEVLTKHAVSIEMGDWANQFSRKENWFDGYIGQPLSERNHNATFSETGNHIVSAESGKELVLYVKYDISSLAGMTVKTATLQVAPNDNDGNSSKVFNVFRVPLANWQTTNGPAFDTSAPLDTFKTPALPWTYTQDADFRKTKEGSGSTYAYLKGTDEAGTTAKNGFNVASAVQDAINNNETHVCFAIGRVSSGRGTFSAHFYPGLEVYTTNITSGGDEGDEGGEGEGGDEGGEDTPPSTVEPTTTENPLAEPVWYNSYIGQSKDYCAGSSWDKSKNNYLSGDSATKMVLYAKYDMSAYKNSEISNATLYFAPNSNNGNYGQTFAAWGIAEDEWSETAGPAFDDTDLLDTVVSPGSWTAVQKPEFANTSQGSTFAYFLTLDVTDIVKEAASRGDDYFCLAIGRTSAGYGTYSKHFYPGVAITTTTNNIPDVSLETNQETYEKGDAVTVTANAVDADNDTNLTYKFYVDGVETTTGVNGNVISLGAFDGDNHIVKVKCYDSHNDYGIATVEINEDKLCNASVVISGSLDTNMLGATFTAENLTDSQLIVSAIIAVYAPDNSLYDVSYTTYTLAASEQKTLSPATLVLTPPESGTFAGYSASAMFWEHDTMIPLTESVDW